VGQEDPQAVNNPNNLLSKHPLTNTNSSKAQSNQNHHQALLVSATASRPSRHSAKDTPPHHQQPPTCTTPAVAADPPVTIQLLNSNVVNVKQTQDRQLESAKTFTEQYSLPDDITITPIIVSNPSTNNALLMINSSISIVSAPQTTVNVPATKSGNDSSSPSSSSSPKKKKEKDIVHLIDPRSGHKTTIAKHISTNKNLLAGRTSKSITTSPKSRSKSPPKERNLNLTGGSSSASAVSRLKSNMNKIGSIKVGKLNPDLDVIVINNNNRNNSTGSTGVDGSDNPVNTSAGSDLDLHHHSQNGKLIHERMQNQKKMSLDHNRTNHPRMNNPTMDNGPTTNQQMITHNNSSKSVVKGNRGQILPRRIALVGNDNNTQQHKLLVSKKGTRNNESGGKSSNSLDHHSSFSYSLPPGISISPGVGANLSITPSHTNQNVTVRPMTVQNYQSKQTTSSNQQQQQQLLLNQNNNKGPNNNKKRISLNECIDGLQKKRMKLLEDHNLLNEEEPLPTNNGMRGSSNNSNNRVPGSVLISKKSTPKTNNSNNNNNGRLNPGIVFPINKSSLSRNKALIDAGSTSARVRDPEGFSMGSTVIKSSDAIVAVSALVTDPESYHAARNFRAAAAMTAAVRGHSSNSNKNGLKRSNANKLQSRNKNQPKGFLVERVTAGNGGGGSGGSRSTRSSAANAKIRTRLSTKPTKLTGEGSLFSGLNSRSRSRLLRQRNQIITGGVSTRKSESDCSSTNTSRSSSAVRLAGGVGPSGGGGGKGKYSTQAYINAVADLYQYRRNVMLRVPKAGVGIFPSASSVKLLNIPSQQASSARSLSPGQQNLQQLSPGNNQNIHHVIGGSSSRSSSPSLVVPSPTSLASMGTSTSKGPVGSMAASAAKKRAVVKPLSPSAVNGALILQLGIPRRQPKWSNGWRFEGEPYEAKVLVNVSVA